MEGEGRVAQAVIGEVGRDQNMESPEGHRKELEYLFAKP